MIVEEFIEKNNLHEEVNSLMNLIKSEFDNCYIESNVFYDTLFITIYSNKGLKHLRKVFKLKKPDSRITLCIREI